MRASARALLHAAILVALLSPALVVEAKPSNKWRVEFSGGADSDGTVVLLITPEGGTPIEASIEVKDGTSENHVAKTVVQGLKAQLPEDGYHVERDDGEDVLIKKRHGTADFDLEVVSNTVKGVRIHPERE